MESPRILMCAPDYFGIEYEINPWMNRLVGTDPSLSLNQWKTLRDLLLSLGVQIETLDPIPGLPDLVFTANAGLVYGNRFLVSRFRHGVRRAESPYYESWARAAGYEVLSLPETLYFEGAGDALFCGETLFAGYRFRSDAQSHQWIAGRLGVEVLAMELMDPRFYHLDTCFCPLGEDEALYYPGAFDDYGRAVLQNRIPRLIEVSAGEAVSFSCNAVVVGRNIVLNAGEPKIAQALEKNGYHVHPIELTEFIKSGGSAKCLTLRLDGEEAAKWKHAADFNVIV
ncbi:MAG: hypothetical protein NVSMB9_15170 [Isosphaeraceae bacterium]